MAWHVSFVVFCFKCLLIAEYNGRDWRKTFIGMFMLCQVINRFEKSSRSNEYWCIWQRSIRLRQSFHCSWKILDFSQCFFFFFWEKASLGCSVRHTSDWWPGGCGFDPCRVWQHSSFLEIDMKYFLRSFSPFHWFKKSSCLFLVKACTQALVSHLMDETFPDLCG